MNEPKDTAQSLLDELIDGLEDFWHRSLYFLKNAKKSALTAFARWSDPKLEPYREQPKTHPATKASPVSKNSSTPLEKSAKNSEKSKKSAIFEENSPKLPTPTTIAEFLDLMKRTPRSVLNQRERHVIAAIMKFPDVRVSKLMLPQNAITYVKDDEVLGPLTLDRLYRSGFQHFPVLDKDRKIIGLIHTTALNSLEIRETSRARDILDPKIYYLREDYTLNQALAAFLRTNCYFFLVVDRFERIVGILTYQMLTDYLLGETPEDNFDRDSDRLAVAKRKM